MRFFTSWGRMMGRGQAVGYTMGLITVSVRWDGIGWVRIGWIMQGMNGMGCNRPRDAFYLPPICLRLFAVPANIYISLLVIVIELLIFH
jgi:hypothetical protein